MYDLRQTKIIDLSNATCLKKETTYKFKEKTIGRELIAKFISDHNDVDDVYLITEFRKLALLSGEPEIATVYYIATGKIDNDSKSCYIMEYIEGKTLDSFLINRQSIIYDVLIDIILQLASGLEKAHNFEIFHSDLHKENILINDFGFVKIIDFLWMDYNLPKETNREKDILDFKNIVNDFYIKCKDSEKPRFKLILDYCNNIKSFKGIKKDLDMINDFSFDFALLDENSNEILSKLFEVTTLNAINMIFQKKKLPIPENLMPPLSESEKATIERDKSDSLILALDTRIYKIENILKNHIGVKLFSIKQVGLIDWKVWITNEGEPEAGPYKLNFRIMFTSKFLSWKRINEYLEFVKPSKGSLYNILFK